MYINTSYHYLVINLIIFTNWKGVSNILIIIKFKNNYWLRKGMSNKNI